MLIISKSQLGDKQWPQTVLVKYKLSCLPGRRTNNTTWSRVQARRSVKKVQQKIQFAWDTLTINFGPLAGQRFGRNPKWVTDYSRTRHVRVHVHIHVRVCVICICMEWVRNGVCGVHRQSGDKGEHFDCYPLVPFLRSHWQACGWKRKRSVFYGANICWYVKAVDGAA